MTSKQQPTNQFQLATDEGDIYEASREPGSTEWLISFPAGDRRFDGTKSEVAAFIKSLMGDAQPASVATIQTEQSAMTYVIKRYYGNNHDYLHGWCDQWGTSCMGSIKKAMTFATKAEADAAAEKAQRECKGSDGHQATGFTFTAVLA